MILIATDKAKVAERWKQAIEPGQATEVVDSTEALLQRLGQGDADLALMHLSLPGLHDGDGIALVRKRFPNNKLLVFSDVPTEEEGLRLLRIGMHGYLNTYISLELLAKALRVVSEGEVWVGRRLLVYLIDELKQGNHLSPLNAHHELELLTPRELEIALMVAQGEGNKRIAQHLGITERTVKAHLSAIFRKTGTHNRVHLALLISASGQPISAETGTEVGSH